MQEQRSPMREPMVWLMIGLPAASVVAGLMLVVTAVRSGGDDVVGDEVRRTAQVQVAELAPDELAASLHLSAVLRIGSAYVEVLPASGAFDRHRRLELKLAHPTDASRDRRLLLEPTANGWRARTTVLAGHGWLAQLTPADGRWRLRARVQPGQVATLLSPSLLHD